nr:hypothetical protein BaRGS_006212 [Batillaria attramentaria]
MEQSTEDEKVPDGLVRQDCCHDFEKRCSRLAAGSGGDETAELGVIEKAVCTDLHVRLLSSCARNFTWLDADAQYAATVLYLNSSSAKEIERACHEPKGEASSALHLLPVTDKTTGGSIFPHKRIHKATWRSPDHVTENQIDHICISRKFRRSWRDVRVMRGADVSSDHHLLATTLRLRLKRHTNANSTRTRYNVGLLRNTDTQAAFRISLSNRFQPLQDLIEDSEMDIETQWEHSKKLWHDTCEEVLGKRKTQHKEWISADTIQKLEVRKEKKTALNTSRTRRAKAKAQEEYTAADREVKRSTRKDKRDYIDNLASQAEEAARQGNLKDLYQVTKKLMGKFQQTDKPVKDKNGHPLTTTEEQLKRWAEHFRELLNRPIPETPPDIPPAETELPINCDKPSKAEIRKAIMTLRNGKAAGPDEIPAEAIKADTETAVNMLHSLFSKIWEKEEVPAQWKEGIVIKLPKKGDLRDCSNYRGIMLLSVPGKVLNRILLERMREAVDPMLRDQQAGFRKNRSCADQIASLRIIVEQSLEWNSPLYINFIDYEKAFDSVDREALWKLLRHYGVPGKIISLIQCTYQDMSCRIAHAGQLSESFEVKTGVRQGCLLSPFLFLLVIDWIMKTTTAGRKNGIQWTLWTQLDDLDFADDLALLSHSHSQMQDKTTCLEATSAGTGLKINRKKTELMKINTTANTPVTVGGEPIREVESFVYLGSVVDGQGGTDRDVTARIGKARAAMVMLKNVWASKVVSIRTKLRIFNSNVKSVLLYGCETWRTTKTMQQKIQTFLNTCLRRIFNIRWPEKIRNEELWERAGQEPVAKQILRRKWGWIGHTLRKPASSTTRQALTWNPQGKRKRGRPRNSWRRDTEAELCKQGTNWTGVARLAQNRLSKTYGNINVDIIMSGIGSYRQSALPPSGELVRYCSLPKFCTARYKRSQTGDVHCIGVQAALTGMQEDGELVKTAVDTLQLDLNEFGLTVHSLLVEGASQEDLAFEGNAGEEGSRADLGSAGRSTEVDICMQVNFRALM